MEKFVFLVVFITLLDLSFAYSKYGRSCRDIGCPSNQKCVMAEDPCFSNSRPNTCGTYPTCVKVSNAARTCKDYICPEAMTCKMDGKTPKCVGKSGTKAADNHRYRGQIPGSDQRGGHRGGSAGERPRLRPEGRQGGTYRGDYYQRTHGGSRHNDHASNPILGRITGSVSSFGKDLLKTLRING